MDHPDGFVRVTVAPSSVPAETVIANESSTESPASTLDTDRVKSMLHDGDSLTTMGVEAVTGVAVVEPEFAAIVKGEFFVPLLSARTVNVAVPPLCETVFEQSDAAAHVSPVLAPGVRVAVISEVKLLA